MRNKGLGRTVAEDPFSSMKRSTEKYYRKKPWVEALMSSRPFGSGICFSEISKYTKPGEAGVS